MTTGAPPITSLAPPPAAPDVMDDFLGFGPPPTARAAVAPSNAADPFGLDSLVRAATLRPCACAHASAQAQRG
jgi:hypothetical protein